MDFFDATKLKNIVIGLYVGIIDDKERYLEGDAEIRRGYVKKILSKSDNKKGIKVKLSNGRVGRVFEIYSKNQIRAESFKFYNTLFYLKNVYSLYHKKNKDFITLKSRNGKGEIENIAFIFSSREKAENIMKKINSKDIILKRLSKKDTLAHNFDSLKVDKFLIDNERKVSYHIFNNWEKYLFSN